ncbi:MAG: hemerythrin domain-containing protein [Actinomycetota bacterium]|nr:hemerythrin domain-containing protein [Actinomycetota bacterium]
MMDALTLLIQDHGRTDALFDRFEQTDDPDGKQRLVREFTYELSVHAAIEEQWLYPLTAQTLEDGRSLAGHSVDEHQRVKDLLAWLDGAEPADLGYEERVGELITEVRHHVEEEETQLFPKLREAVPAQQLETLGAAMAMAKVLAPTRPHPHAPNTPPVNVLAGPVAAVVDALRDQLPPGSAADRLLDAASLGQDITVQAVQAWMQQAARLLPGMVASSYGEEPPDATEMLDQAFDVAERLLDTQRKFVHSLLDG